MVSPPALPGASASSHLLIPFAGRGTPGCLAALADLRLPHLEALLARLTLAHEDAQPPDTLSPPHERALADALGLPGTDGCIPWAAREAQQAGLAQAGADAAWGVLTLCHWEVAIDEVVLDDPYGIAIDAAESDTLLAAARPFFEEDGIALHATATPGRWLACGELLRALPTASLDRVAGQPISAWSPQTEAMRPWRKLQNEMQMLLYTQRVNDERMTRGVPSINSFWVSGTGALPPARAPQAATAAPEVAESLRRPALRDDGAAWAEAWHVLDAGACARLLAEHQRGADVTLTLCGDRGARRYAPRSRGFGRWLKGLFGRQPPSIVLEAL
ncbi:MAG: hypothetical protein JWQ03_148 [Variovorax sp.]|nr:hypothetical protein [Variovorax sp.]